MKRENIIPILIIIVACLLLFRSFDMKELNAQSGNRVFTQTDLGFLVWRGYFNTNGQDTIRFSLNDSRSPTDTTFGASGVNNSFPAYGTANGNIRLWVRRISGGTSAQAAFLIKPIHPDGNFYLSLPTTSLDSLFAFGSTTLTDYKSVFTGTSIFSENLSGSFAPTLALAVIPRIGTVTGAKMLVEIGIIKNSNVSPANIY